MEFLIFLGIVAYNIYALLKKQKEEKEAQEASHAEPSFDNLDEDSFRTYKKKTSKHHKGKEWEDLEGPHSWEAEPKLMMAYGEEGHKQSAEHERANAKRADSIESRGATHHRGIRNENLKHAMMWHIVLSESKGKSNMRGRNISS